MNASSPTARTSSMSSTSGSTWIATAKPRRMYIPDEYVLTGASMNVPQLGEIHDLVEALARPRRRLRPSMIPLMATFSRPLISGWKPAPSSMRAEMRPSTRSAPRVGLVMPASSLSRVDLPEPFSPMTPKVAPRGTSKETPVEGGEGLVRAQVGDEAAREERALEGAELVLVQEAPVDLGDVARATTAGARSYFLRQGVAQAVEEQRADREGQEPRRAAVAARPRQWSKWPSNSICW